MGIAFGREDPTERDLSQAVERLTPGERDARPSGGTVTELPGFQALRFHIGDFERGWNFAFQFVERPAEDGQLRTGRPGCFAR